MGAIPLPPISDLRETFECDNGTGSLFWKVDKGSRANVGGIVGCANAQGHLVVRLNRHLFRVHRIVWAVCHDEDPGDFVMDHIDGNPHNNKISNLQKATQFQNSLNAKLKRNDTSGVTGVSRAKVKKWCSTPNVYP